MINPRTAENYIQCAWRRAWLLFDLDNGHSWGLNDHGKGYVWVFKTKKEAIAHKKLQKARPFAAQLSPPIKVEYNRKYV